MVISAITVADEAFSVLVCRPAPLAFDARGLSDLGLPQRLIALDELRDLLVERVVRGPAVDEVWRHLTLAARSWGPEWVVGAVGLAVPGLRAIAARLAAGRGVLSVEEAELIGHQRVRDVEVAAADAEHLLDTEPGQGGPHGSAMFIPALPAVQRSTRASTRHGLALPDRQR